MTEHVDAVVIGAGVVGLSVAKSLAEKGYWTIVLEAQDMIGTGASSRNSEVIHAGIYYPTGSLKAEHCIEGKIRLYEYAQRKGFEARDIGKLIVAHNGAERDNLEALHQKGLDNGVEGLDMMSGNAAVAIEPNLFCVAALHSTTSGIVDSHSLMLAMQGDLEEAGGMVAFNTPVAHADVNGRLHIETGGEDPTTFTCDILVNAAGLHAPTLARTFNGLAQDHIPKTTQFCKGNYFSLEGVKAPFRKLIYPMPNETGLGIHATTDMNWQNRFGPDVEWIDEEDYAANSNRLEEFETAIKRYFPGLPEGCLVPVYAGIRPKIVDKGEPNPDFLIQGKETHGIEGLVNLFGIESPGLTSALSLGHAVSEKF